MVEREKGKEKSGEDSGFSHGRILFMDDEAVIREVYRQILEAMGYTVVLARNGREAVDAYREAIDSPRPFDAVILDLEVKDGMGGLEAIREILFLDPRVKAIICSGYADDPAIVNCVNYGFRGALMKPHKLDDLKAMLEEL